MGPRQMKETPGIASLIKLSARVIASPFKVRDASMLVAPQLFRSLRPNFHSLRHEILDQRPIDPRLLKTLLSPSTALQN